MQWQEHPFAPLEIGKNELILPVQEAQARECVGNFFWFSTIIWIVLLFSQMSLKEQLLESLFAAKINHV